jgi:hypothetical protein
VAFDGAEYLEVAGSGTTGLRGVVVAARGRIQTPGGFPVASTNMTAADDRPRVASDSQLTAQMPDGASTGPIAATTPLGTGTSSTDLIVKPKVQLSPPSGPVGTVVTIKGTAFTRRDQGDVHRPQGEDPDRRLGADHGARPARHGDRPDHRRHARRQEQEVVHRHLTVSRRASRRPPAAARR